MGKDSADAVKRIEFIGNDLTDSLPDSPADERAAVANGSSGNVVLGMDGKIRSPIDLPQDRLGLTGQALAHKARRDSMSHHEVAGPLAPA